MANLFNHLVICGTDNNLQLSVRIAKRIRLPTLVILDMRPERRTSFRHPDIRAYARATRRTSLVHLLGVDR